jgi:hypothetical protein
VVVTLNCFPGKIYKKRQKAVAAASAGAAVGTLLVLNEAWYKQYPRTSFQTFDDSREWLQIDKLGHAWTTYQLSRATTALWQWAGAGEKKAVLLGSVSTLGYMTAIEWLDAYSQKWGWSWADVGANMSGAIIFASQQLAWKEQKIQFKLSFSPRKYPADLQDRANNLFGTSLPERMLKDYNAQRYWLSANLKSFWKESNLPAWLNVSVGYGASGMFGGFENLAYDKEGNIMFDRRDIPRRRHWYLAPDVDFSKIKTNRKGLKLLLSAANCLKFPAPALEWSNGTLRVIPLSP